MSKFKVGDFVKGIPGSPYGITTEKMTRGLVVNVSTDKITVKVLEHEGGEGGRHHVDPKWFEVIGHAKPFDREEVLELLRKGCKKAVLDYDLSGANLRCADLSGADLSGADLSGANLSDADLSGADLSGANLRCADLSGADLRCANLRCADLSGANLSDADLRCADLSGADLDFSCFPLWCGSLKVKTGSDARIAAQLAYHLCSMQCDDAEYIAMRNSILDFANTFHRVGECGRLTERKGEA